MTETIMSWLRSDETLLKIQKPRDVIYAYVKLPKNDTLDFIYSQYNYNANGISRSNFDYVGIYNKITNELYDVQYNLSCLIDKDRSVYTNNIGQAKKECTQQINDKINATINNDRKNSLLQNESEIKDISLKKDLEYSKQYKKRDYVRDLFLSGKTPQDIKFTAHYSFQYFEENEYVEYLMEPSKMVKRRADDWINRNAEKILSDFIVNDIIKDELQKIIDDTINPLHTLKTIIDVIKSVECKTVNVTTIIDGIEFTFKSDASQFRHDCGDYYSTYNIVSQDRKKFENLYGKNKDFTASDIVKITTGKKVLYQKNS